MFAVVRCAFDTKAAVHLEEKGCGSLLGFGKKIIVRACRKAVNILRDVCDFGIGRDLFSEGWYCKLGDGCLSGVGAGFESTKGGSK